LKRILKWEIKEGEEQSHFFRRGIMKKLQPGDEIVRTDEELGIAWILLPPDAALGGFRGISPRIMNEEKFIMAKKKSEKKKS
jgi:hypothetical protein